MQRRKFIRSISAAVAVTAVPNFSSGNLKEQVLDLSLVRNDILDYCNSILDKNGPYGCYRRGPGQRPDLYASCDVAILRTVMGEDLKTSLADEQRHQWIDHINSFANRFHINGKSPDGSYFDTFGHSVYHANGMVIGALGVLGGKQAYPVKLYDVFNQVDLVSPWLEKIDWVKQWSASHLFWGGMHCYSQSSKCSNAWKEEVFHWLAENLDQQSGWWKKGVPCADRHQPLGGSVHILPIYQHLDKRFPIPEKVIDSVLDLQLPNGRWLKTDSIHMMHYLDLDALYALKYMSELTPDYKTDKISQAVHRYSDLAISYWEKYSGELFKLHPHHVLAAVSTFGLLHQHLPERFTDNIQWLDIFSDKKLYQTDRVEVFE
jgi:hypothetical protein